MKPSFPTPAPSATRSTRVWSRTSTHVWLKKWLKDSRSINRSQSRTWRRRSFRESKRILNGRQIVINILILKQHYKIGLIGLRNLFCWHYKFGQINSKIFITQTLYYIHIFFRYFLQLIFEIKVSWCKLSKTSLTFDLWLYSTTL